MPAWILSNYFVIHVLLFPPVSVTLVVLHISHHVLVGRRGDVALAQRPLQAGTAHNRQADQHWAVLQLELLVDVSTHRGDDRNFPQQVIVPDAVPIPDLENNGSVEETQKHCIRDHLIHLIIWFYLCFSKLLFRKSFILVLEHLTLFLIWTF